MVKEYNWLWSTLVQSCFCSFSTGKSNRAIVLNKTLLLLLKFLFVLFLYSLAVEENRRTTPSVSWLMEGQLVHCCCTLHTYKYMIWLYPWTPYSPLQNIRNIPYLVDCWLHLCRVGYSILRGLGNVAKEKTTAGILYFVRWMPPLLTVDVEQELHKPNNWTKHEAVIGGRIINISCVLTILIYHFSRVLRSGVVVNVYWNTWSLLVLILWWEDLLHTSYYERTYCMPVMMRRPIVWQLWWEGLLYASYDERTCMPVMMRGPLYASYDETYYIPVMMRGPIVCQLWCEDLLSSYDEKTYCMPVVMREPIVWELWWEDLLYAEKTNWTQLCMGWYRETNKQGDPWRWV